jgi:hypothetical protein
METVLNSLFIIFSRLPEICMTSAFFASFSGMTSSLPKSAENEFKGRVVLLSIDFKDSAGDAIEISLEFNGIILSSKNPIGRDIFTTFGRSTISLHS